MKDNLEKYVSEHREDFDVHIPDPSVWKRIEKKKPGKKLPFGKRFLITFYRVAALVIVFLASYAYHEFRDYKTGNKITEESIYEALPELQEAEQYYGNLVDMKLNKLKPLFTRQPEIQSIVSQDLSELDSIYVSLKKDLRDNIANDQVLEAMIQNYRLKLEILEELLHEVTNQENDENKNKNFYRL